jgi:predicted Fe-Mo cluster-binding NifX family protein
LIKEKNNMKIAISAVGKGLDSSVDVKFERCNFFLIVDTEKNSLIHIENKKKDRPHEIGGTVGQLIANEGIDSVIASDIGPSAFDIFKMYGIKVYQSKGVVEDAIRLLKDGELIVLTKPTVPSYSEWKKNKNLN